jgi:hypothetical protein
MKRLYLLFAVVLICLQQVFAQNPADRISIFRTEVLPQYSTFFKSAELNASGQLLLYAEATYQTLSTNEKKLLMDKLVKSWQESLVVVSYGAKNELWSWNGDTSKAIQLDTWDINAASRIKPAEPVLSETASHPWFVYLGGLGQYNSSKYLNVAFNSRIGFYLLRNRLDFAWTMSFGGSGYDTASFNTNLSYGIMSKLYFPIKKTKISPNVGVSLENTVIYADETSSNTVSASALAGISWFVGRGSLDLEFKISKDFTTLIGYTFYPSAKKKR